MPPFHLLRMFLLRVAQLVHVPVPPLSVANSLDLASHSIIIHTNFGHQTRGKGQHPQWTLCHKFGHNQDHCYKLHGSSPHTANVV